MYPVPANEKERQAAVDSLGLSEKLIHQSVRSPALLALVNIGRELFDLPVVIVNLIDNDWQHALAACGFEEPGLPRSDSICAHAIMQDDIFVVPDLWADERFAHLAYVQQAPFLRFYAGIPLGVEPGYNIGSLCLLGPEPREFSEHDRARLRDLGLLAANMLRLEQANVKLTTNERALKDAANTDPLTGCLNRLGLREEIGNLFELAVDPDHGAGLVYVDIDHFKTINDSYGHPAGDTVLREVANRIKGVVRGKDLVARIGGDEFCVVLRDVPGLREVEIIATRLVDAFKRPIILPERDLRCTISVGAALAPTHATTREGIAHQADIALYRAKEAGRGTFRIAA